MTLELKYSDKFMQGREEGEHTKAIETAAKLKKLGVSLDIIKESTGLSMSEIQNLK